jgi:hypothetical protein
VPIACRPPVRWISPGAIADAARPPRDRFVMRVDAWIDDACIEIRQDGRLLARVRHRRLVPNRSIAVDASWIGAVDRDGPEVIVTLDGGQKKGGAGCDPAPP